MQLSRLASEQKRTIDWNNFIVGGGVPDPALREAMASTLATLRAALARCWQAKVISPEDDAQIEELTKRMELLSEEARLRVGGSTPIKKEETFERPHA